MTKDPLFSREDTPEAVVARIQAGDEVTWAALDPATAQLGAAKLRLAGVYDDRQAGWFMLRTRIPGGALTPDQADAIAGVVEELARRPDAPLPGADAWWDEVPDGFVEITTRQDLQLHWVRFETLAEIWRRFEAVGLSSLQACGDTLRNVTTCPVAGASPREIIDPRPVVEAIGELASTDPRLTAFLPRKFKVAVTGCPTDCIVAGIHDLAFTPARRDGALGFHVCAGGGLSDSPRLATPLPFFVHPDGVQSVVRAALELFAEHADPDLKAVNRFRVLVHSLGVERVAEEIRSRAGSRTDSRTDAALASPGDDLSDHVADDHLGIVPDGHGTSTVGICVPLGRLGASDLRAVARLARTHGDGGIRLTQRQNLVFTGIRDAAGVLAEPLLGRFPAEPDPFQRAVVACTSAPFCKFGVVNAKAWGARLIDHLRRELPRESWEALAGLRIHVSGCKASCAQTQVAHIGLRGAAAGSDDGYEEAFDVAVGGDAAQGSLGRWVGLATPAEQVFGAVTELLVRAGRPEAVTEDLARAVFEGALRGAR